MYKISEYSKSQASKLNVKVKPSNNKNKKIDVYKNNKKIASIGAINYKDYPTYLKEKGFKYAEKRKELYKLRHKNDINKPNTNGYYADKILW